MRAKCSDRRPPGARTQGFTIIELVVVLVLLGIVAVAVMPKLDVITSMRGSAWRDQVVAALHHAQSQAASHRRLVCMEIATVIRDEFPERTLSGMAGLAVFMAGLAAISIFAAKRGDWERVFIPAGIRFLST